METKTEHTPGPWEYVEGNESYFPHVLIPMHKTWNGQTTKDKLIINVGFGPHENHEANARLIAAAPDLLEACKSIESQYSYSNKRVSDESISKISAALKKALGL